ncbi:hypothetical protein K2173_028082 [Erythroxylum novogranatense]|uniref:Uncharacterized protein n=1 Tax=Erythroxylum novogranatense TaxID=1862640 RepID=A0AAV8U4I3_9ROSI|nr:hypothetical protein K2173_028082 [Erythroxylum novogranatense]
MGGARPVGPKSSPPHSIYKHSLTIPDISISLIQKLQLPPFVFFLVILKFRLLTQDASFRSLEMIYVHKS